MSIEYSVNCDGCGRVLDVSSVSAAVARKNVSDTGGRVNLPGGEDLCSQCVEKLPASRWLPGAGGAEFGNHKRWHVNRARPEPKCRYCLSSGQLVKP
jgi:hypothetical protein